MDKRRSADRQVSSQRSGGGLRYMHDVTSINIIHISAIQCSTHSLMPRSDVSISGDGTDAMVSIIVLHVLVLFIASCNVMLTMEV